MRGNAVAPAVGGTTGPRFQRVTVIPGGAGVLLMLALILPCSPAAGQQPGSPEITYHREIFEYQGAVRADPFRSRLSTARPEGRSETLLLRGIVYSADPRESVAILIEAGSNRRIRVKLGERVGGITVIGIYPRRVDLLVDELGVKRRQSLHLKVEPEPGSRR